MAYHSNVKKEPHDQQLLQDETKQQLAPRGNFGETPFTATEFITIADQLNVPLARSETATRPGPGGVRLTYIEGWKVIQQANMIFGFNGWSSKVLSVDLRYIEEMPGRRYNCCVCATVRIILRDGTSREDRGGGVCEGMRSKGDALLKAEKEAVTDATKRALKNFGLRLGLSLYDRQYVREMNRTSSKPVYAASPVTPAGPRRSISAPGAQAARSGVRPSPPQRPVMDSGNRGQPSRSGATQNPNQAEPRPIQRPIPKQEAPQQLHRRGPPVNAPQHSLQITAKPVQNRTPGNMHRVPSEEQQQPPGQARGCPLSVNNAPQQPHQIPAHPIQNRTAVNSHRTPRSGQQQRNQSLAQSVRHRGTGQQHNIPAASRGAQTTDHQQAYGRAQNNGRQGNYAQPAHSAQGRNDQTRSVHPASSSSGMKRPSSDVISPATQQRRARAAIVEKEIAELNAMGMYEFD